MCLDLFVCIKGQRESEYNLLGERSGRMNRVISADGTVVTA